MDIFSSTQPDEGYSEYPLASPSTLADADADLAASGRDRVLGSLALSLLGPGKLSGRTPQEVQALLVSHLATLPVTTRSELIMSLLRTLPTSTVSDIVDSVRPRLNIDFMKILPTEVSLKILGFLDPVSLLNVAKTCRSWYSVAIDGNLWRRHYLHEGWKLRQNEVVLAEELRRVQLDRSRHSEASLPRVTSQMMEDPAVTVAGPSSQEYETNDGDIEMGEAAVFSIFGNVSNAANDMDPEPPYDMDVDPTPSDPKGNGKGKGKGKAIDRSPQAPPHGSSPQGTATAALLGGKSDILPSTLWLHGDAERNINYKYLYSMRHRLERNWEKGRYTNFQFPHPEHPEEGHSECIYSLQFDAKYLVSGSRDRSLRIWDLATQRLVRKPLEKHTGSVLCLQFDAAEAEDLIVSGSSDSDVIVWRFSTGEVLKILKDAHHESVLNVRFDRRILVTCSKDKTIKVFNRRPLRYGDVGYDKDAVSISHSEAHRLRKYGTDLDLAAEYPVMPAFAQIAKLEGHTAAVNAVQIHGNLIVSASGDRNIKIWDWTTRAPVRHINDAHIKGIACVQFDGRRIVSGSNDREVKVFDALTGVEVASLQGHDNLVRTVQAGFGDLPWSAEEDREEARRVDGLYFDAVRRGEIELFDGQQNARNRGARSTRNAGSSRPEDIRAVGAKIPPGGGGGKYARIVSGSYDQTIIIWRRDKDGIWKEAHRLRQDRAAVAAQQQFTRPQPLSTNSPQRAALLSSLSLPSPPIISGSGSSSGSGGAGANPSMSASTLTTAGAHANNAQAIFPSRLSRSSIYSLADGLTDQDAEFWTTVIGAIVHRGPIYLQAMLQLHPILMDHADLLHQAIELRPDAISRAQLRQALGAASLRAQLERTGRRSNLDGPNGPHGPHGLNGLNGPNGPSSVAIHGPGSGAGGQAGGVPSPASGSHNRPWELNARREAAQAHANGGHTLPPHQEPQAQPLQGFFPDGILGTVYPLQPMVPLTSPPTAYQNGVFRPVTAAILEQQYQHWAGHPYRPPQAATAGPSTGSSQTMSSLHPQLPPPLPPPPPQLLNNPYPPAHLDPYLSSQLYPPPSPRPMETAQNASRQLPPPPRFHQARLRTGTAAEQTSLSPQLPPSTFPQLPSGLHSYEGHQVREEAQELARALARAQDQVRAREEAATAQGMATAPAQAGDAPAPGIVHGTPARVFKLQFDARRIICCSQTNIIVGWDFCNGDKELEEVTRFFGTVE